MFGFLEGEIGRGRSSTKGSGDTVADLGDWARGRYWRHISNSGNLARGKGPEMWRLRCCSCPVSRYEGIQGWCRSVLHDDEQHVDASVVF